MIFINNDSTHSNISARVHNVYALYINASMKVWHGLVSKERCCVHR